MKRFNTLMSNKTDNGINVSKTNRIEVKRLEVFIKKICKK